MILGIDPGERRVGVAIADLETRIAHPLEVIDRREVSAVERIASLANERGATAIVVGTPLGLSGREGPAVARQREFVAALRAATQVEVVTFDERLTSVLAEQGLRASGAKARVRKQKVDAVAAQILLQSYLDREPP